MTSRDIPENAGAHTSAKAQDAARAPRQTRGQARVDAILDSAASILVEEGMASVTMHTLARRARASIGSMYYFFPDRESVLNALFDRHAAAIQEIGRQLAEIPAAVWRRLSAEAAIERVATPYVEYLRSHSDYLSLMHVRSTTAADADFIRTIMRLLEARLPGMAPTERQDHAAILHSIAAGAMHVGLRVDPERTDIYLREIPRVLTLYLADIEAKAVDRR